MYKITANDWDGMNFNTLKLSTKRTRINNRKIKEVAERYTAKEKNNPSPLENAMMKFLDSHNVKYEFQKPCYIYKDGVITQFFILDFYVLFKKIVIETDGKFHNAQVDYDEYRTKAIKKQHPNVTIIRWKFDDFYSPVNMKILLEKLK